MTTKVNFGDTDVSLINCVRLFYMNDRIVYYTRTLKQLFLNVSTSYSRCVNRQLMVFLISTSFEIEKEENKAGTDPGCLKV